MRTEFPGLFAPKLSPASGQRYTLDANDELERHLALTCDKIASGVRGLLPRRKLEAVMLGGGYGRGEGGVLQDPQGDRPYNDLEFYVCLRENRHLNEMLYHRPLEVFGEILTPLAGAEVELKIISLAELARTPVSMFSYDLVMGHRWLLGGEELLDRCAHHREARRISLIEATRLMMNRCSGLLFAYERLERPVFTATDADFVRRNIAKAELAFGDAVLAAHNLYHWSCRKRHLRLRQLVPVESLLWLGEVQERHAAGVEFKLHPERSTATRETLQIQHADVSALGLQVWLWLEERRLHAAFSSACDYAEHPINKCPEATGGRALLVNLKARGPRSLLSGRICRHPRERVLHALALLLWEPDALTTPSLLQRLRLELDTRAVRLTDMLAAYRALWSRVK